MNRLLLLALALVLAACGSTAERTGAPASASGEGTMTAPGDGETGSTDESTLKPPRILLLSFVGKQTAVQGSYCVEQIDEEAGEGHAMCSDAALPTFPETVTAVARGNRVAVVVPDAVLKTDSIVTVRPLGCIDEETTTMRFEPGKGELVWDVDLEPGAYQLDVFARFETADGRSGDVSGALGLTVAGAKENDALGLNAVRRSLQVCPFSDR